MGKRGQGEGNIIKRKDGLWQTSIMYTDPITKLKKRPTLYGKTRNEVKDKLIKMQSELQTGINISPDKIQFGDWLDRWIENYAKSNTEKGTWQGYETNIRVHIKPLLGQLLLSKLQTDDLQSFYNEKRTNGRIVKRKDGKNGLSENTIRLIHAPIFSALKQAVENKMIPYNVAESVKRPKRLKRTTVPTLRSEELTQYLSEIKDDRNYAAFVLESVTGLRRSELLGLEWHHIVFKRGIINIEQTLVRTPVGEVYFKNKTKNESSRRTLTIPDQAMPHLLAHKVMQEKERAALEIKPERDLVFCQGDGDRINPSTFSTHHRSLIEKSGVRKVSFHSLRHSVATALLEADVDLKTVSEIFGHASVIMTGDLYADVLERMKRKASNKLGPLIPV